jgi:hypothetical protein
MTAAGSLGNEQWAIEVFEKFEAVRVSVRVTDAADRFNEAIVAPFRADDLRAFARALDDAADQLEGGRVKCSNAPPARTACRSKARAATIQPPGSPGRRGEG